MCPTFQLAAVHFAAEGAVEFTVLTTIDSKRKYKGKIIDPVPGFVVDLAEALLGIKVTEDKKLLSF